MYVYIQISALPPLYLTLWHDENHLYHYYKNPKGPCAALWDTEYLYDNKIFSWYDKIIKLVRTWGLVHKLSQRGWPNALGIKLRENPNFGFYLEAEIIQMAEL